ncbi:MAG TPA: hypothetical protein VGF69_16900 [Thermoanaerobaculia bacterium]|jgi:hypothetical protein
MAAIPDTIISEQSLRFYRHALAILKDAGIPHLVGGAYAFARYAGIERHTKDFDVFIRREDYPRAAWAFQKEGYKAELTHPHWLGKAFKGDDFVDLIFSAGNAVAEVDDLWFEHAVPEKVFGVDVLLIPAEEMIWSKGLIMERERFDGADVAHVIHAVGHKLDWKRLLDRYANHWRVLFAHLTIFGYIYPSHRSNVPKWVIDELTQRMRDEADGPDNAEKICFGTIISRQQYLMDINAWGYKDARLDQGLMTQDEIDHWTAGISLDGSPK